MNKKSSAELPFRASVQAGTPDIAFIGKAGSGKTTAADWLQQLGWEKRSFATPLKEIAAMLWGEEARTDRDKLQNFGVAVRSIDPNTWCELLVAEVLSTDAPVVVDDCRFENEYFALKGYGFKFVRITAPTGQRIDRLKQIGKLQDVSQLEHVSETAIDHLPADLTIKNDTSYTTFIEKVSEFMKVLTR